MLFVAPPLQRTVLTAIAAFAYLLAPTLTLAQKAVRNANECEALYKEKGGDRRMTGAFRQFMIDCQSGKPVNDLSVSKPRTAPSAASEKSAPKEVKGPVRTYVCSVPTSEGAKRRVAWERSVEDAQAKAYQSYASTATVRQEQIDCKLR